MITQILTTIITGAFQALPYTLACGALTVIIKESLSS